MKRITVSLPTQLGNLLDIERRQRDTSASAMVREALEAYLRVPRGKAKRLPFIGIGDSGGGEDASRIDEFLKERWADDIYADSFGLDPPGRRKSAKTRKLDVRGR